MIGVSWGDSVKYGNRFGGVEVWDAGIKVAVDCNGHSAVSPVLSDYSQILSIYHALGEWLMANNPLPDPED
jgi:hypothetical protein